MNNRLTFRANYGEGKTKPESVTCDNFPVLTETDPLFMRVVNKDYVELEVRMTVRVDNGTAEYVYNNQEHNVPPMSFTAIPMRKVSEHGSDN